eukprot:s239_g11.t1
MKWRLPSLQREVQDGQVVCEGTAFDDVAASPGVEKEEARSLVGLGISKLGFKVHQKLLEVLSLRSSHTGKRKSKDIFPLPTSRSYLVEVLPVLDDASLSWFQAVCISLNSLWGGELFFEGPVSQTAVECLKLLYKDVRRLEDMSGQVEEFSWDDFFSTRGIDYKGDEVRTAQSFCWGNIKPALPVEIGRVPLEEVCTLGAKHYVLNFDAYLKDQSCWEIGKAPKVMVADEHWSEVCSGLVGAGVCAYLPVEEVFDTGRGPLLNGLFGVSKEEWDGEFEVYRLIMNLIPLNRLAHPLKGDVETLPSWSLMNPYFLQPSQNLLISSEDVRCFFYTMAVPHSWYKYLAFNKRVPDPCLPVDLRGREVYLCSRVLPMGFLNSVSLAQHVHRNLSLWSDMGSSLSANPPEGEIRKDRPLTEYEKWDIPRNFKKAVSRQYRAEVQGAQVDGQEGVAYPREGKLLKYLSAALSLMEHEFVTQKQLQVVCGGLVYISMFRRPLLGCLNSVWGFIESFNSSGLRVQAFPQQCKAEIMRLVSLLPLARLDFRLPFHPQVTCSDASTSGGGVCASMSCSRWGELVAEGQLRGQLPELRQEHQVLTIGLFDGISALRVAADLLGLQIIGHVSVEPDTHAKRVVESHFPEVRQVNHVQDIDEEMVREWSRIYSQASVVFIGGGPPCQGVSGLNCDRKGALRDERSKLFVHVHRIIALVRIAFPWCQVHGLMESVASMDAADREVMSESFGCPPWKCDAGTMTWCSRPRLYWLTWDLQEGEGVTLCTTTEPREVILEAHQDLELVCQEGWIKVDCSRPFPTFTTSRPRASPGRKPAGVSQCSPEELARWQQDDHRFPPYQYANRNLLVGKSGGHRLPTIEEKEFMMGFPVDYTHNSIDKQRKGTQQHLDIRHTLVGNSWSVPIIAWLMSQLFSMLGLCRPYTPQELMDLLTPSGMVYMQARLWRRPLQPMRGASLDCGQSLVEKLSNMISVKGEDILLTTPSSQLTKYHRLRASVPARLWRWRIIAGWRWGGSPEHINSLELRSVLTSLRQRLGSLKNLTVQPATKARYTKAVDGFLQFLKDNNVTIPRQRQQLDPLLCDFLEYLWSQGHGRALASDTVAGLQDQDAKLKGQLQGAWRLLKTWSLNEVPNRAPPLPEHVLHAMTGWAFFHGHISFGVSLLLGYYAMLRTGELLALKANHLYCDARQYTPLLLADPMLDSLINPGMHLEKLRSRQNVVSAVQRVLKGRFNDVVTQAQIGRIELSEKGWLVDVPRALVPLLLEDRGLKARGIPVLPVTDIPDILEDQSHLRQKVRATRRRRRAALQGNLAQRRHQERQEFLYPSGRRSLFGPFFQAGSKGKSSSAAALSTLSGFVKMVRAMAISSTLW